MNERIKHYIYSCPTSPPTMKKINIGCGKTYHRDWENLDLVSHAPEVRAWDLTKGLPYADQSVDVCYSSHVLEHLRGDEATFFLREQHRALKPGGLLRIVVPDLETICRNYLEYLDRLARGDRSIEFNYDFTLLELFDQTTREFSGGELGRLLTSGNIPDLDCVLSRTGEEAAQSLPSRESPPAPTALQKVLAPGGPGKALRAAREAAGKLAVRILVGRSAPHALQVGLFRQRGEIHRVMYDRFSLSRILEQQGFTNIAVCAASESRLPDFASYQLDTHGDKTRKPDSLFMEANRPQPA